MRFAPRLLLAGLPALWLAAGSAAEPKSQDEPQAQVRPPPETCTYESYSWSTVERRAVNRQEISHPYAEVTDDERDPNDPRCTICLEDQAEIDPSVWGLDDVSPFRVCWAYREMIDEALRTIVDSGAFDIVELDGYRSGRTRGRVVDGLRTEWSNHSFGTAIDINADDNGLYNDCAVDEVTVESLEGCRLSIGGDWDPERRPRRTIIRGGVVYGAFTDLVGWRWGGELSGRMRDLMHFSLTGE